MDIFGGGNKTLAPTAQEFESRLTGTQGYWENYQGFQKGIDEDLSRGMKDIDTKVRRGTLSPLAGRNAEARLNDTATKQRSELQSGPTYQLLQNEFKAQRDFAEKQFNEQNPVIDAQFFENRETGKNPGGEAGFYGMGKGGGESGPQEVFYGAEDPNAGRPSFEFASTLEDFFGERFGPGEAVAKETGGKETAAKTTIRQRSGGGQSQAVGVGEIYNWY